MRPSDPPWYRPLLGHRRALTRAACAELGLTAWDDPHNSDPRFTRVRLRTEVLPLLEQVLGGGVAEALARTASALREDTDALDGLAADELPAARVGDDLDATAIEGLPAALRRRVIRAWLLAGGASGLTDPQIRAVDAVVVAWRGQGPVAVSSDLPYTRLLVQRRGALLTLRREPV
jgi:tRNA(Ile)-lysidine synthase